MDEAQARAAGLHAAQARVRAHRRASTDKAELPALIAHLNQLGVDRAVRFVIHQDDKDSTKYVADCARAAWACPTATTT